MFVPLVDLYLLVLVREHPKQLECSQMRRGPVAGTVYDLDSWRVSPALVIQIAVPTSVNLFGSGHQLVHSFEARQACRYSQKTMIADR